MAIQINDPKSNTTETLEAPKGIPTELTGDFAESGTKMVQTGLNILFFITAVLAMIVMMYSGIQWMTSSGNPERVAAARRRLMFAILGLVLVIGAFLIVRVITSAVGADPTKFTQPTF